MKKILFFLESLAGGGAEKVLTDIVYYLDKSKYDITVCTVTDGGVYQERVSSVCHYRSLLQASDYRAGGFRKAFFWLKMKMIYLLPAKVIYNHSFKERYDIEVAFIEGYATKIIAASPNGNSKKIAWVHSDLLKNAYADKSYSNLNVHRDAYEKYDQIVCVSEGVKKAFQQKFFPDHRVVVQHNPVDERIILQQAQEPISCPHQRDKLLLGSIGRLEQVKGYLRLLECAKILHDKGYPFALWIIGKGSQQDQLEKYILENDLTDTVKLLGFQSNPYKYMNQCDAFICSSYAEGFSTAATESLILGKPVFTVDCAGMNELIGESACGKVVPNTDEALYQLLEEVVSCQIDMAQYAKNAEERGRAFRVNARISEIDKLLSAL